MAVVVGVSRRKTAVGTMSLNFRFKSSALEGDLKGCLVFTIRCCGSHRLFATYIFKKNISRCISLFSGVIKDFIETEHFLY